MAKGESGPSRQYWIGWHSSLLSRIPPEIKTMCRSHTNVPKIFYIVVIIAVVGAVLWILTYAPAWTEQYGGYESAPKSAPVGHGHAHAQDGGNRGVAYGATFAEHLPACPDSSDRIRDHMDLQHCLDALQWRAPEMAIQPWKTPILVGETKRGWRLGAPGFRLSSRASTTVAMMSRVMKTRKNTSTAAEALL
ncbi:uncharacterized protein LOC144122007 isoform X2 [Amblyomma americanum]